MPARPLAPAIAPPNPLGNMPMALLLALRQLDDPALLSPLLKGLLGAAAALAVLVLAAAQGVSWLAASHGGWLAAIAPWLGGAAGMFLAWWLFLPISIAIAGAFAGDVAAAVERRHYPTLPPARGASAAAQTIWALRFGLRMVLWQLLLLPLLLIPVAGFTIALVLSARLLGTGMFEGTALFRMGLAEARAARRARWVQVWLLGLALALLGLVPVLNLLVPILGSAAAVHLLHRPAGAGSAELLG